MFSGIVESQSSVLKAEDRPGRMLLKLEKPSDFDDLKLGDSISVNGVCLTLESQTDEQMDFSLAAETLQITGWNGQMLEGRKVNLERSLRLGDRIHGHLVTGHVDAMGSVVEIETQGESVIFGIQMPQELEKWVWKKGSVAINGVSLTVNEVENQVLRVCLIPETLKRTNLSELKVGSEVTIEVDNFARGLVSSRGVNSEV